MCLDAFDFVRCVDLLLLAIILYVDDYIGCSYAFLLSQIFHSVGTLHLLIVYEFILKMALSTGGPFKNPIMFVAFDNEEDGLVGSKAFVEDYLAGSSWIVTGSLIMDTVMNYNDENDTQYLPNDIKSFFPKEARQLATLGNKGVTLLAIARDLDETVEGNLVRLASTGILSFIRRFLVQTRLP